MSEYVCRICIRGKILSMKNKMFSELKDRVMMITSICPHCNGTETVDWITHSNQQGMDQRFCSCDTYFNSHLPEKDHIKLPIHHNHVF